MLTYSVELPDKTVVAYTDRKRLLWLSSCLMPLLPLSGIGLCLATGDPLFLLVPLVFSYLVMPVLDWLIGLDENNPPEEIVPQLDEDRYYRILTYATVPLHFAVLIISAWFVATADLPVWAVFIVALSAGAYSGLGINTAHEMGHKKTWLEKQLAKVALAVPAYGHFCVEHNRGHHVDVATPDDPASSRMGESIYRFVLREIPGAFRRGWLAEQRRLQRLGKSAWSTDNEILQSYALSVVVQGALILAFGWIMLPFLLVHNFWAWFQLTSANYIEHYGLLRTRLPNGRFERCLPHHSWNANHIFSNLALFHLERHSDHHANPTRRYQSLRNFDDIPQLPNGYYGMFVIAYIPWLWYWVMDKRVLALPHIRGDMSKVNLDPAKRDRLLARYAAADA